MSPSHPPDPKALTPNHASLDAEEAKARWLEAKNLLDELDSVHARLTRWEQDFIIGLCDKFDTYGERAFVSEDMLKKLRQIAEQRL